MLCFTDWLFWIDAVVRRNMINYNFGKPVSNILRIPAGEKPAVQINLIFPQA